MGCTVVVFLGYVASFYWCFKMGHLQDREPLVCMNHYSNLQSWNYKSECRKFREAFESSGLQCFVDCAFKHIDRDLISAFVERWYPETSTFHLPWGEMTITSYDVKNILGTEIRANMFEKPIDVDNVAGHKSYIVKLFGFDDESWNAIHKPSKGFTISLKALRDCFKNKCSDESDSKMIEYCVNAYCSYIIGNTIAASKDGTRMPMIYCISLEDIKGMDIDMTTSCLSYLFVELGKASRAKCVQIGGYLTLLQAWIYEHFPKFAETLLLHENYTSTQPRAQKYITCKNSSSLSRLITIREMLDSFPVTSVIFDPYQNEVPDSAYMQHVIVFVTNFARCIPDRVIRQFGYRQSIPLEPMRHIDNMRPMRGTITRDVYRVDFCNDGTCGGMKPSIITRRKANPPYMVKNNYLEWYYMVSHPIVSPPRFEGANDHIWNYRINNVLGILNDAITKHSGKRTTPKVLLAETIKARDVLENIPGRRPFALKPSESLLREFSFQETQTDLVEE